VDWQIPSLTYEDVRLEANRFAARYWASGSVPVDIEHITEFELHFDVIPVPGLKSLLKTDAFLYSDFSAIAVDQWIYTYHGVRHRFSLAHELGHYFLHRDLYAKLHIGSIADYQSCRNALSDADMAYMEDHAYWFAGMILLPLGHLERAVADAVKKCRDHGVSLRRMWDTIGERRYICEPIGRQFNVSREVVGRQIELDGLDHKYGLAAPRKSRWRPGIGR